MQVYSFASGQQILQSGIVKSFRLEREEGKTTKQQQQSWSWGKESQWFVRKNKKKGKGAPL
jgi:hypothetical protein